MNLTIRPVTPLAMLLWTTVRPQAAQECGAAGALETSQGRARPARRLFERYTDKRMIRAAPFVALLFVAAAVRADCDTSILVVDENAEEVEYRDCWQVEYVVHEAFPARGLIRRVTDRLAQQGWRKLDIDPFEPSAPDAPVHAWTVHHAKDQDKTRVDQWLGWFIREDQSRLQLTLRYLGRAPDDQSSLPIITTVTYVTPQQWELRPK